MKTIPTINFTPCSAALAAALAAAVLTTIPARGAPWTPADLANKALWLDASDATTVTLNGSTVSQWNDKSGNSRNVSQGTAANQPAYSAGVLNGNPAITFDGSNDYLSGNLPDSVFPSNITLIHVFVPLSTASTKGMLQIASALGSTNPWLLQQQDSTSYKHYVNSGYQITETIAQNSPYISVLTYSGSQWISWLNGTQGAAYTGARGSTTGTSLYLGNGYNGYWNGRFGEVIATTSSLATEDRQKLEGYLAWKWGLQASLPADHPYKNAAPGDAGPPAISTLSPANNATGVAVGANLVATFSKSITVGTGNITIRNLTANTQSTIAVTDASQVSVAGSVLTINPAANLAAASYAIRIDATAIKDSSDNFFAGIADDTTWTFTTDGTPPTLAALSPLSPADDTTGVAVNLNLVATFSENISKGTGYITLRKSSDDSPVEQFDVASSARVTVSGATLTIAPTSLLEPTTGYYVEIDAGAIKDPADNSFAGINGSAAWNFTTATPRQLTWDANGTGDGQTDGTGNWLGADQWWDGAANTTWNYNDSATIGSGGTGGTITLASATAAGSVAFNNNFSGTYTLSGGSLAVSSGITVNSSGDVTITTPLGGAGGVAKSGTGTLTLPVANTYSGGTVIDDGTILVTTPGAGLGTGTVTVNANGVLTVANTSGGYAPAGLPNTLTGTGTINMAPTGQNYALLNGDMSAFAGTVYVTTAGTGSGSSGNFVALGTSNSGSALAKWVLSGTYNPTNQGPYLVPTNAVNHLGQLDSGAGGGVLGGKYNATTTWEIGGLNTDSNFSGVIQNGYLGNGAVSITKVGTGTLTLSGVNVYTGTTTVSNGTLLVNSPGSLAAASTVTVNGGTLGGSGTLGG